MVSPEPGRLGMVSPEPRRDQLGMVSPEPACPRNLRRDQLGMVSPEPGYGVPGTRVRNLPEMVMTDRDPEILESELVQIYRDYGFMTMGSYALEEWNCKRTNQGLMPLVAEALARFDNQNENIRVREIGVILNELGGHALMARVATNVVNTLVQVSHILATFRERRGRYFCPGRLVVM